jgi:spore coat polysaccharide biosynthesis predicted glycosyltransferase SpsG
MSAYDTAEGLYLTTDPKALNLESAKTDLKIIDGLLLSEMDFNKIKELQFTINVFSTINQKICHLYKSNLNQYLKHDDEFINFYDYNGNE